MTEQIDIEKFPWVLLGKQPSKAELRAQRVPEAVQKIIHAHRHFSVKQVTRDTLKALLIQSGLLSRFAGPDQNAAHSKRFWSQSHAGKEDAHMGTATLQKALRHLCRSHEWGQVADLSHSDVFFVLLEQSTYREPPETESEKKALERHGILPMDTGEVHPDLTRGPPLHAGLFRSLAAFPKPRKSTTFPWHHQKVRGICAASAQRQTLAFDKYDTQWPLIINTFCTERNTNSGKSLPLGGVRLMHSVMLWARNKHFPGIGLIASRDSFQKCFYNKLGFRCIYTVDLPEKGAFKAKTLDCRSPANAHLCGEGMMYADLTDWDGRLPVQWPEEAVEDNYGSCGPNARGCLLCQNIGQKAEQSTCSSSSGVAEKAAKNKMYAERGSPLLHGPQESGGVESPMREFWDFEEKKSKYKPVVHKFPVGYEERGVIVPEPEFLDRATSEELQSFARTEKNAERLKKKLDKEEEGRQEEATHEGSPHAVERRMSPPPSPRPGSPVSKHAVTPSPPRRHSTPPRSPPPQQFNVKELIEENRRITERKKVHIDRQQLEFGKALAEMAAKAQEARRERQIREAKAAARRGGGHKETEDEIRRRNEEGVRNRDMERRRMEQLFEDRRRIIAQQIAEHEKEELRAKEVARQERSRKAYEAAQAQREHSEHLAAQQRPAREGIERARDEEFAASFAKRRASEAESQRLRMMTADPLWEGPVAEIVRLWKKKHEELSRILTPEEYEDYVRRERAEIRKMEAPVIEMIKEQRYREYDAEIAQEAKRAQEAKVAGVRDLNLKVGSEAK